jgi:hypothetical protein
LAVPKPTLYLLFLLLALMGCKSQDGHSSAPFTIEEKTYFNWVSEPEGKSGTSFRISGTTKTMNLSFSKVYFQNHAYEVVPEFRGDTFVLAGEFSEIRPERKLHDDPREEYGNPAPPTGQKIPFELEQDEAVILYTVSGQEAFFKVSGMHRLQSQ